MGGAKGGDEKGRVLRGGKGGEGRRWGRGLRGDSGREGSWIGRGGGSRREEDEKEEEEEEGYIYIYIYMLGLGRCKFEPGLFNGWAQFSSPAQHNPPGFKTRSRAVLDAPGLGGLGRI